MFRLIFLCVLVHHDILINSSVIQDKLISRICGRINQHNFILENIVANLL